MSKIVKRVLLVLAILFVVADICWIGSKLLDQYLEKKYSDGSDGVGYAADVNAYGKEGSDKIIGLFVDSKEVPVIWEDNATVNELKKIAEDEIVITMRRYGGNEQFGEFPVSFTCADEEITASAGDIIMYRGNQIAIFYGSGSVTGTKIGKVDLSEEQLNNTFTKNDVKCKFTSKPYEKNPKKNDKNKKK
ncbi:MAG: hypothetical protein K5848_08780 [Lachnospiraceae bacterium]|nr:hypothetical protein [Lachnospiraceae bacterium]